MPRVNHPTRLAGTWLIMGVVASWHPSLVAQSDSTINSPKSDSPRGIELPEDDSPAAKMRNFDIKKRVPGRLVVKFKSDEELEALRQFTPDRLPTNVEIATSVAKEITEQVGGQVIQIIGRVGGGFVFLIEATDEMARELANDPRVKRISPEPVVEIQTTQSLPSNNTIWHLDCIGQINLPINHAYNWTVGAENTHSASCR